MPKTKLPDPATNSPPSRFEWRIHHPKDHPNGLVAVEVGPRRGLVARWRFVLPADFKSTIKWGVGEPDMGGEIRTIVRGASSSSGAVRLIDGPSVVWFGGLEPLSIHLKAYLLFDGEPPHYIMFGQAESPQSPPSKLEGVTFGQHDHHAHARQAHSIKTP